MNGGAVVWCRIKQGYIADFTMEVECVIACEVVWLRKFQHDLEVVPNMNLCITLLSRSTLKVTSCDQMEVCRLNTQHVSHHVINVERLVSETTSFTSLNAKLQP
ncbi:gag/pol protein [Cucumis melo var. makuwa]|uniref:Gag/pol protein n=1 Tax=Cucumis melo var. makuwa TaxID=1194695 RepID=A0A5D3C759_CUCMM|nr:gag/pol protein [Cucumis melo var. makuwa]TYK06169.1 gag/pol protein [Cucumis melo var. makuwa]